MSACPFCQYHTGHAETCLARPRPPIDDCAVTGYQPSCPVHGTVAHTLAPRFDGETVEEQDHERLSGQLDRVHALMRDGAWRTLGEIAAAVGGSEAGVSARLRDLRKPGISDRLGGPFDVVRERVQGGLWRYRMGAALRAGRAA